MRQNNSITKNFLVLPFWNHPLHPLISPKKLDMISVPTVLVCPPERHNSAIIQLVVFVPKCIWDVPMLLHIRRIVYSFFFFFFLLSSIPFHGYSTFSLSIQLKDICIVSTFWWLWIKLIYRSLCKYKFQFFLVNN